MSARELLNPLALNEYRSRQRATGNAEDTGTAAATQLNYLKRFMTAMEAIKHIRAKHVIDNSDVYEEAPFPVDVVYTWVENTDTHRTQRAAEIKRRNLNVVNSANRFSDNGELLASIRSIYSYAPWVNRIIVVVQDGQYPSALLSSEEQLAELPIPVHVVRHSDIFSGECAGHLPTYNSHSIEVHLNKIPGLAEHFIYFNDDMFVSEPTQYSAFFTPEGNPKYRLAGTAPFGNPLQARNNHAAGWCNNNNVLDALFPKSKATRRKYPAHQAVPMLKSTYDEAWNNAAVRKRLVSTSASTFRGPTNVYLPGLLVYWNIYSNKADTSTTEAMYHEVSDTTDMMKLAGQIIASKPTLLCVNDGIRNSVNRTRMMRIMLKALFPIAVPPERA